MTREEQLEFCKICNNRRLDPDQGFICKLTNEKADFEGECESFIEDEALQRSNYVKSSGFQNEILAKIEQHQNLLYAIIGGAFVSVICALIWAAITVSTEMQIGFMAIGLGFLVGIAVRIFGAGIDQVYGFVGAALALIGCLLGNLFSQVGFIAEYEGLGYLQTIMFLDFGTILQIYQESFSIMDVLFYGFAIYEGYRFSFRMIPENFNEHTDFRPPLDSLRLPLVVVFGVILAIAGFNLSKGVSGEQVFHYESGEILSKGEFKNGSEQGIWNYYYEGGGVMVSGEFVNGVEEGFWEWYFENGDVLRNGYYTNGLFDSVWTNYIEGGTKISIANYDEGRLNGQFLSYFEDGSLMESGMYERDRQVGEWKIYYNNGKLNVQGSLEASEREGLWKFWNEDGTLTQEIEFEKSEAVNIRNVWNQEGVQMVKNGNGVYESFFETGELQEKGIVENGKRIGKWTSFYKDGGVLEIGQYDNDQYLTQTAFSQNEDIIVENGNGYYLESSKEDGTVVQEGSYLDGQKDGKWLVYYPNSAFVQEERTYVLGELNGPSVSYFPDGVVSFKGRFESGELEGMCYWYFENGLVNCSVSYENGKKEGDQIFWSEIGKEAKVETYKNGELISESLLR